MTLLSLRRLRATSFPGFSPTRSGGRVGENPGNEVGLRDLNGRSEWDFGSEKDFFLIVYLHMLQLQNFKTKRRYITILRIGPKLHKNENAISLDPDYSGKLNSY